MPKKNGALTLAFANRFEKIEEEVKSHENILHGEDGKSGLICDNQKTIDRHTACPVFNLQKMFWIGIGAIAILNLLFVAIITGYFNTKFDKTSQYLDFKTSKNLNVMPK